MGTVSLAQFPAGRTIAYPPDGAALALDPDIPAVNQSVLFGRPARRDCRWILNGKPMGRGPCVLWKPQAGRFTLTLAGQGATVFDRVVFTVR